MNATPVAIPAPANLPILSGLGEIADSYDVVLSDIWGVVHNGREAHPEACDATRQSPPGARCARGAAR